MRLNLLQMHGFGVLDRLCSAIMLQFWRSLAQYEMSALLTKDVGGRLWGNNGTVSVPDPYSSGHHTKELPLNVDV